MTDRYVNGVFKGYRRARGNEIRKKGSKSSGVRTRFRGLVAVPPNQDDWFPRSPARSFSGEDVFHLVLLFRDETYSCSHLDQIAFAYPCARMYLLRWLKSSTVAKDGKLKLQWPSRKWSGVNALSLLGSELTEVSGRKAFLYKSEWCWGLRLWLNDCHG